MRQESLRPRMKILRQVNGDLRLIDRRFPSSRNSIQIQIIRLGIVILNSLNCVPDDIRLFSFQRRIGRSHFDDLISRIRIGVVFVVVDLDTFNPILTA